MRSLQARATSFAVVILATVTATLGVLTLWTPASGAVGHHKAAAARHAALSTPSSGAVQAKATVASGAKFEVCDVAGDTGQNGATFPILEGNWSGSYFTTYNLTAGAPPGGCGPKYSTTPGAMVLVEQGASPGAPVSGANAAFSVSNGTIDAVVSAIDFAAVTVNSGLTVLTITDTTPPAPSTGTLELCKTAGDHYVTGSFAFDVTGPGGFSSNQSVPAGQCNDVPVPSGNLSITESVRFPYALASVATLPSSALVSSNRNTQNAVVSVPPNGSSTVFFTNSTLDGYAKICKTLDRPQDNVLAGQTFNYSVTVSFNGSTILSTTVPVTAASFGTTTCTFIADKKGPIPLPLGSTVTATETVPPNASFQPVGTSISPSNLNAGSSASTAVFYVGNQPPPNNTGNLGAGSVTQATFTNEALGSVEVCKTSSTIQSGTPFNFTIGGVGSIQQVDVGLCSLGFQLPVGTTTITESPVPHVTPTLASTTAGGSLSGNTATVTVPYNSENIVTFNNEINTGTLKICKAQTSSDAGLQNTAFTLGYSYVVNGVTHSGTDSLKPGQCALPIRVPVLNSDLSQVKISITEQTTSVANVAVESVMFSGPDTVVSQPTYPHLVSTPTGTPATVVVNSLEGITNVTFVNGIDIVG